MITWRDIWKNDPSPLGLSLFQPLVAIALEVTEGVYAYLVWEETWQSESSPLNSVFLRSFRKPSTWREKKQTSIFDVVVELKVYVLKYRTNLKVCKYAVYLSMISTPHQSLFTNIIIRNCMFIGVRWMEVHPCSSFSPFLLAADYPFFLHRKSVLQPTNIKYYNNEY